MPPWSIGRGFHHFSRSYWQSCEDFHACVWLLAIAECMPFLERRYSWELWRGGKRVFRGATWPELIKNSPRSCKSWLFGFSAFFLGSLVARVWSWGALHLIPCEEDEKDGEGELPCILLMSNSWCWRYASASIESALLGWLPGPYAPIPLLFDGDLCLADPNLRDLLPPSEGGFPDPLCGDVHGTP